MSLKNREEYNAYQKEWRRRNPERSAAIKRKCLRKYRGVINPTGEVKFGACEICEKEKKLCLDHDHKTGLFRGWLCFSCNTKLAFMEKYKEKAEAYLCHS